MKKKHSLLLLVLLFVYSSKAQLYAPPVGQTGSNAIYKDSSIIVNWASSCKVHRGYQDISNTGLGYVTAGDSTMAVGKALSNGVVSLGDGGWAICKFNFPIVNGPGPDFAVFENAFDDYFLELAFVEVSSDGLNYFRFPTHSLTDTLTQTGTFDSTDAIKINNLAGKFRIGYGTPFDLQELSGMQGLDLQAIRYVKVIDAVGSIQAAFTSRDSYSNKINDPWPTPFSQGGFDLDAIGVIHEDQTVGLAETENKSTLLVYPNPVKIGESICIGSTLHPILISLCDYTGKCFLSSHQSCFQIPELPIGIYFLKVVTAKDCFYEKIFLSAQN